jgi:carbohydrate diacid regulator
MITAHLLNNIISGIKSVTQKDLAVLEKDGSLTAQTDAFDIGNEFVMDSLINSPEESHLIQGHYYVKVYNNDVTEYVIVVRGDDPEALQVGRLAALHLHSLIYAYKKRDDRDHFIRSILLENMLSADINSRAKKLAIEINRRRVVYLIEAEADRDRNALEIIRSLFPAKQRDYVTSVDDSCIVLVKELREKESKTAVEQYAGDICGTLSSEIMSKVLVTVGTVVNELKNLPVSYREACTARDVGKIFQADKQIIHYNQLGIGRLIYQLPVPLCKMFVNEVLGGKPVASFDDEALNTVQKFFDNDLNVSETARDLYIHRNTLVYRLDKLQKQTGLDLRNFDDAITFKMTLMVSKYIKHKERH